MNLPDTAYGKIIPLMFSYIKDHYPNETNIVPSFDSTNLVKRENGIQAVVRFQRDTEILAELTVVYDGNNWSFG
ncbi:hypothetical protein BBN03_01315 [Vibrio parahaemolyticus]|uniref:hypothetical protein n=1 Tax=Vibrio parahaemolyticus TaxID=670 RepID=UPI00084A46A5|nr:hypothetical protein [Vibrio parahaemolyticus]EJI6690966.1 hypothetical protein [Vibrio parahaemolyticus]MBE4223282.1 hypothetical protein [Vibrio parahaemolyticus]OEA94479.1 hypothetical protein BBN03_01315 [Vibrio parahaemolyticus]